MKTIVMKFQGPMQSYGTASHFETRHTDDYPSKAAVLGLVAAALGIRREEADKLQKLCDLHVVVRVDQTGRKNREYQTAYKAKYKGGGDEHTYVTHRYYLEDAVFLVALEGEDDSQIESIYEALKKPYFALFYGRRSCPVNYDFLVGIYEGMAIKQVGEQPWKAANWYKKKHEKQEKIRLDVYGDKVCMPEAKQKMSRRDQPVSFSQMGRQHDLRFEAHENMWIENPAYVASEVQTENDIFETEHDAFAALMEE